MKKLNKLISLFTFLISIILFAGCLENKPEELNYKDISDFYGPWELTLATGGSGSTSSGQYAEYLNFLPDGTVMHLKVYNPNYYPKGMIELNDFAWSIFKNNLSYDVLHYKITFSTTKEIFLSGFYNEYKLNRIPDTLWDYLATPDKFEDHQSVDQSGTILNYKSKDDFCGNWKIDSKDSFGYKPYIEEYADIYQNGTIVNTRIDNSSGTTERFENTWRISGYTFYWDILNYNIDYCKEDEISLSRSATHLILKRI